MVKKSKNQKHYVPKLPKEYQGRQVIINADRLLFNAKEDSILQYAKESISLQTPGSVHIDTGENEGKCRFIVNSPEIILGMQGPKNKTYASEPALLGKATADWLDDLLDLHEDILLMLLGEYNVTVPDGAGSSGQGDNDFDDLFESIEKLRTRLSETNSEEGGLMSKRIKIV